jgi:hypothetical protein
VRERFPWKTELLMGDPIQVGQRQLIPVARVRSVVQRRVTFGTKASSGRGGGLVWIKPVAVVERHPDGSEEQIPISDETWIAIRMMLIGVLALPVLYALVVSLAFWRRRRLGKNAT